MIGIPGSGKSTYVNENFINNHFLSYQILCLDDYRLALGDIFNVKVEGLVASIFETSMRAFMERGLNIVSDGTNINPFYLAKTFRLAKEYGYTVRGIFLNTPFGVCKSRKVGKDKIDITIMEYMREKLSVLNLKDFPFNILDVINYEEVGNE